ncbi:hypothetical protein M513_13121 [Trichuris suis]|uniref:Uncharacterized protein n=1 Tax=Trichuris suis TaxID=68888 RepID=A0A085LM08_9BILA|nr:hypothetical protein M513_13121 [Trichuris suis]
MWTGKLLFMKKRIGSRSFPPTALPSVRECAGVGHVDDPAAVAIVHEVTEGSCRPRDSYESASRLELQDATAFTAFHRVHGSSPVPSHPEISHSPD